MLCRATFALSLLGFVAGAQPAVATAVGDFDNESVGLIGLRAGRGRTLALVLAIGVMACGSDDGHDKWEVVTEDEPGALLSVWGQSATDVWVVGGDRRDGSGPVVLRVRGDDIERLETGEASGDLWWVSGLQDGTVFMGGSAGLVLRYSDGEFTKLATPGAGTVFGLWGTSASDMWAVGGQSDASGGFAWRLVGDEWIGEAALPADVSSSGALWKVHGTSASDAWLVGSNGMAFHWDGSTLEPGATGVGSSLFTVFGNAERYVAVGGLASGIIVENEGDGWVDVTPEPLPPSLAGVSLGDGDGGVAVGFYGSVYERIESEWVAQDLGFPLDQNLHGAWIDPEGGVWAVGGNTIAPPLSEGVLIHRQ